MSTTPTANADPALCGTLTANGIRLYYEESGRGAPILGIHGAGSSALVWGAAARELSRLGRVIVYDRRGCSRSERPEPYVRTSVAEHADDAHRAPGPAIRGQHQRHVGHLLGRVLAPDVDADAI